MSPAAPSPRPGRPRSLLRELLIRLMAPLLAIVAATGALGLTTAQWFTERTFDRWLLDSASSLAQQVRFKDGQASVDLDLSAEAILTYDAVDRTYYAVRQGERLVAGQAGIPDSGGNRSSYFDGQAFDAEFQGHPVRVATVTVRDGSSTAALVLVAETLVERQGVRTQLRLMLLPLAVLMVAAAAAIVLALRWTLQPLQNIATRWRAQSHASLQPVGLHDVPQELAPFASALNDLLARIQELLLRERRFAANAAHQIRTPLAGLALGLSRAAEAPDLASTRAVIDELRQTTQRTARLLQQLLALGRLDPEQSHEMTAQPMDLSELAQGVGEAYLAAALQRDVMLELELPEARAEVRGRADLVSEALGNLVDNALRYTPAGGRVVIAVQASPPALTVSDSGPGIAAAERESMFERFVRGRDAAGDGSGLGLAIVREIASLHGASVTLQDSPLGGLLVRLAFTA